MGADSVLVRASLGADVSAAGAAVPNMKPLYDSNLSNMKTAFGVIDSAMDMYGKKKDALKLGKDNQLKGFKSVLEQNYARLFTQDEPMPQKVINAVDKRVRELQDDFEAVNTYGKNDTVENERARTRLTASLKRIVNQAVAARTTFMKLGDNTKHWNDGAIKDGVIAPQMKMMDTKNMDKDDDVFVGFDDNNDMIFSAQNYYTEISGGSGVSTGGAFTREEKKSGNLVSFSLSQMEENIPGADLDLDAHVIETMNAFGSTQAQSDASMGPDKSYNKIDFANELGRKIQTPEDFRNLALRKVLDTEPSLKSALQSDFGIANELLNVMFDEETLNQMDTDNSGDISIADMKGLEGEDLKMFEDNFDIMVSTLTDVDNPNFNLKRSKDLLISYFDKTTNERYNNTFDTKYKALNPKSDETDAFKFNAQTYYPMMMSTGDKEAVYGKQITTMLEFINNPVEGAEPLQGWDGNYYSHKDGKFYVQSPEEKKNKIAEKLTTQSIMSRNLGLYNYGYDLKNTYTLPPPVGGGDDGGGDGGEEDNTIPMPKSRGLTSKGFDTAEGQSQVIGELENLYKPFGDFKFTTKSGSLFITSPNGEDSIMVDMDRSLMSSGDAGGKIQAFIKKYAKTE